MKSRTYGEAAFRPVSLSAAARPFPLTPVPIRSDGIDWTGDLELLRLEVPRLCSAPSELALASGTAVGFSISGMHIHSCHSANEFD
jgi:hypothetical protein